MAIRNAICNAGEADLTTVFHLTWWEPQDSQVSMWLGIVESILTSASPGNDS